MRYKVLNGQVYSEGDFYIVPIRMKDRYDIMKWRNEQMYHLRQNEPLTKKEQDLYFSSVVSKLFEQDRPDQILFSYMKGDVCIGYGGLVHINWFDKNSEISFILDTDLEKDFFEFHWLNFLKLIEKVAFDELKLHKTYIWAFNLRPYLYPILINNGYYLDAILKDHRKHNESFIDVVIHSKIKNK